MSSIRVVDPDKIPEMLIVGPFNRAVTGNLATLTFTHVRPVAEKMLAGPTVEISIEAVVRARLVMPVEGLQNLRDSIDQILRGRQLEDLTQSKGSGH